MATIQEITSVYLDAKRCGVVTCPKCGVTRAVNLAHYTGDLGGKVLKVKCAACATVVNVRFDFRRHHRIAVRLPGTLVQHGTKHVLASLTVTSLSVSGVGFTLCTPLLVQSGEHYDIIFFDSPPILGVSDASVIASEVDQTVIVVQHRRFPRAMLTRVKQAILGVGGTVLGVVLNNVDLKHDQNYYYYTNYYGYYQPQGTKETHRRSRQKSRVPANGTDNGHFEPDEY